MQHLGLLQGDASTERLLCTWFRHHHSSAPAIVLMLLCLLMLQYEEICGIADCIHSLATLEALVQALRVTTWQAWQNHVRFGMVLAQPGCEVECALATPWPEQAML